MNALQYSPTLKRTILLAMIANTTIALAAPNAAPDAEPTQNDQTPGNPQQVADALQILPRVGTNQVAVMPTVSAVSVAVQPGLTEGEDWLKVLHETLDEIAEPSTLAEGAFVLNRPGRILAGPQNHLIFVPNAESRLPGEGPVLLMPCQTLEQLESQWSGQPITISGEVFTYHNRNQLLISAFRIGHVPQEEKQEAEPAISKDETPESTQVDPTENEPSSLEDDPAVRDLLNELNFNAPGSKTTPRSINRGSQPNANPSTQPAPRPAMTTSESSSTNGLSEGTLILRRPSRMVRNGAGAWTIVFDNDTPGTPDGIALIVEPCQMLMRMEQIAMRAGDADRLLVSGRVYTYKGEHYILPTLMQRIRPQEINSLQ